jgi:hypothetical protein
MQTRMNLKPDSAALPRTENIQSDVEHAQKSINHVLYSKQQHERYHYLLASPQAFFFHLLSARKQLRLQMLGTAARKAQEQLLTVAAVLSCGGEYERFCEYWHSYAT